MVETPFAVGDSGHGLAPGPQARVAILALEDDLAGSLAQGLDALGWPTVTARTVEGVERAISDLAVEAVIVDARASWPQGLTTRLKAAAGSRRLPVVGLGPGLDQPDLMMTPPVHPAQAALRLEHLLRAAVASEEFELRRATFEEHGVRLGSGTSEAPRRILAVGEPDPRFLALSNHLEERGVHLTAALTPYTAFDYLHEREFDAVLLWGGDKRRETL